MQMAAPLAKHFNVSLDAVEAWPLDKLLINNLRLLRHLEEKAQAREEARRRVRRS